MFLYLLSYINRANVGNAKIEDIKADLDLTPKQYQITLSIFLLITLFVRHLRTGSSRDTSRRDLRSTSASSQSFGM